MITFHGSFTIQRYPDVFVLSQYQYWQIQVAVDLPLEGTAEVAGLELSLIGLCALVDEVKIVNQTHDLETPRHPSPLRHHRSSAI
jgi:hypothetical protein